MDFQKVKLKALFQNSDKLMRFREFLSKTKGVKLVNENEEPETMLNDKAAPPCKGQPKPSQDEHLTPSVSHELKQSGRINKTSCKKVTADGGVDSDKLMILLQDPEKVRRFKKYLLKNKGLDLVHKDDKTDCKEQASLAEKLDRTTKIQSNPARDEPPSKSQSQFYIDNSVSIYKKVEPHRQKGIMRRESLKLNGTEDLSEDEEANLKLKVETDSNVGSDFEYDDGLDDLKIVEENGVIKIEYGSQAITRTSSETTTSKLKPTQHSKDVVGQRTYSRRDGMFICSHCSREFAERYEVVHHLETKHEIVLDECSGCNGDKFVDISSHHQRYHSGIKTCQLCHKSFTNTIQANRHMIEAHPEYLGLRTRKVIANREKDSGPHVPLDVKEEYEKLFEGTEVKPRTDLLDRKGFLISYDKETSGPDWTFEVLDISNIVTEKPEFTPPFIKDPELISIQFSPRAMKMYPQYDTGHLAAAGNYYGKPEAFTNSYRMSNCRPMKKGFHRGVWTCLEKFIRRNLLKFWDKIVVYTGAIYDEKSKVKNAPGCIPLKVASYFYKALCLFPDDEGEPQTLAFLVPHKNLYSGFCQFVCPVEKIEKLVGFNFFPKFPYRSVLEMTSPICLSPFSCSSTLRELSDGSSVKKRIFLCAVCGKSFRRNTHRATHFALVHQNTKPLLCHICGKSFCIKAHLDRHQKIHQRLKPHVCSICGKSFNKMALFNKHHQIVHLKAKLHLCHICGKSFSLKALLNVHHQGVHLQLKPHTCRICGNSFSQKANLTSHYLVHRDEF